MVLKDKAVLIVEDNIFLAMGLTDSVEDLGGKVVGPVASAAQALQLIDAHDISAAVIDYDLADPELSQIVDRLAEEDIAVVIYAAQETFPPGMQVPSAVPVLRKPIKPEAVVARLVEEVGVLSNEKKAD